MYSLQDLLLHKSDMSTSFSYSIAASYMEIYKDEVYDLLVERENVSQFVHSRFRALTIEKAPRLSVRENAAGQIFVANLTSQKVNTMEEFESIYSSVVPLDVNAPF